MARLGVFEGDVFRMHGGKAFVFKDAFVWSVFDDGTVEMSEMYNTQERPKRWIMSVDELKRDWRLRDPNFVLRRQAERAVLPT